jgi:ABC-type amino acid transport substrate-binding protein
MVDKLKSGRYAAMISDDTQLHPRAHEDDTCALHILPDKLEPFDLAFAFRNGFPYQRLKMAISNSLLELQEAGKLSVRLTCTILAAAAPCGNQGMCSTFCTAQ